MVESGRVGALINIWTDPDLQLLLGAFLWLRQSRIHLQCGRSRFHLWVRKISWRRAWQPTPVFLPGESHGQRSLAGYILGVAESGTRLSDYHFSQLFLEWVARNTADKSMVCHPSLWEGWCWENCFLWVCFGSDVSIYFLRPPQDNVILNRIVVIIWVWWQTVFKVLSHFILLSSRLFNCCYLSPQLL